MHGFMQELMQCSDNRGVWIIEVPTNQSLDIRGYAPVPKVRKIKLLSKLQQLGQIALLYSTPNAHEKQHS